MLISGLKIRQGDLIEQTRLIYTVSPRKFKALAATQGYAVESLEDAEELARRVASKEVKDFSFKKLFRIIPINVREIKAARKQIRVV